MRLTAVGGTERWHLLTELYTLSAWSVERDRVCVHTRACVWVLLPPCSLKGQRLSQTSWALRYTPKPRPLPDVTPGTQPRKHGQGFSHWPILIWQAVPRPRQRPGVASPPACRNVAGLPSGLQSALCAFQPLAEREQGGVFLVPGPEPASSHSNWKPLPPTLTFNSWHQPTTGTMRERLQTQTPRVGGQGTLLSEVGRGGQCPLERKELSPPSGSLGSLPRGSSSSGVASSSAFFFLTENLGVRLSPTHFMVSD